MKQLHSALLFTLAAVTGLGANIAAAGENFWQAPQSSLSESNTMSETQGAQGSLFASLANTEQVDIDGRLNRQQQVSIRQGFSANSSFSMQYSTAREQRNWVLGFQANDLTVSMLQGKGETTLL